MLLFIQCATRGEGLAARRRATHARCSRPLTQPRRSSSNNRPDLICAHAAPCWSSSQRPLQRDNWPVTNVSVHASLVKLHRFFSQREILCHKCSCVDFDVHGPSVHADGALRLRRPVKSQRLRPEVGACQDQPVMS